MYEGDETHLCLDTRRLFPSGDFLRFRVEATPHLLQCKLEGGQEERLRVGFNWLRVENLAQIQWLLQASAFRAAIESQAPGPPSVAYGWLASRFPWWD